LEPDVATHSPRADPDRHGRAGGKGRRRAAEPVEQRRSGVGRAVNLRDEPGDGPQIGLSRDE
jgi:hypothetical protein